MFGSRRDLDRAPATVASAAAVAAAVCAAVYWLGPPGVDQPAHVYQLWYYQQHGFAWWGNAWYSGRYQFVTYSALYYPLAAILGIGATAVLSSAVLGAAATAFLSGTYGRRARGPALLLAVTAPLGMTISGAYPFLCGAAAMAVALLCIHRGWRTGFAVSIVVCLGMSPLALALLATVLAGAAAGMGLRRCLRARRFEAVALAVVLLAGALVQLAFSTGGQYPYSVRDLVEQAAFSAAGIWVCGSRPESRPLRGVFAALLVLNVAAFLLAGSLGSNAGRLFVDAGTALLWLAAVVSRRRSRAVAAVLVACFAAQALPHVRDFAGSWSNPATGAAYWAPAITFLHGRGDRPYRVEVVASWGHWEVDYLPRAGIPIARGWFRQDDFPQNAVLYQSTLTAAEYDAWLRSVGVRYVVLPDAPLDSSADVEAALIRSGRSGLRPVGEAGHLRFYELPRATPIVTGPGRPRLLSLAGGRVAFIAPAAGRYLVRVRYSRYWSGASVARSANGMTEVTVPRPETVRLAVSPIG
jgi:MFS family permease